MTPDDLRAYLERLDISQRELSRQLEVSRDTIKAYLLGERPIPKLFELACHELARRSK